VLSATPPFFLLPIPFVGILFIHPAAFRPTSSLPPRARKHVTIFFLPFFHPGPSDAPLFLPMPTAPSLFPALPFAHHTISRSLFQLLLPSGGELDDRSWQTYMERIRSRRGSPLKRGDMLLCFAKRLEYDTIESGRDTLDSDSSVSTMQIESNSSKSVGGAAAPASNSTHPLLDWDRVRKVKIEDPNQDDY